MRKSEVSLGKKTNTKQTHKTNMSDEPKKESKSQKRRRALDRVLSVTAPEYPYIALALTALAVNAGTNLSFPWIMGKAVDYFSPNNTTSDKLTTERLPYIVGGLFAAGTCASWIRVYYMGQSTDRIASRLRKMLFDSYINKNSEYFDDSNTGKCSVYVYVLRMLCVCIYIYIYIYIYI